MSQHTNTIAVFIDFENLALGIKGNSRFEISYVIKRLLEKGKIVAKKAYCDWSRYHQYKMSLHEAAIELIDIPRRGQSGKNSADIRLCVDAMDLAYSKNHIDTFVVVSGDSDFSPLVSKLKELGKHVIGLGMQEATSSLLRDNCDEFIYYENLVSSQISLAQATVQEVTNTTESTGQQPSAATTQARTAQDAYKILFEGLTALRRDNRETLMSPHIKLTIRRLHPAFDEGQYGFRSWGQLLTEAEKQGLIELTTDVKSKCLVVTRFGDELKRNLDTPKTTLDSAIRPERPSPSDKETSNQKEIESRQQNHDIQTTPVAAVPEPTEEQKNVVTRRRVLTKPTTGTPTPRGSKGIVRSRTAVKKKTTATK
jgi:uncharacterized protein (TIGR00288 family)